MSTLKNKIRKLTASKISTVDNAEIFAWDKWLRIPSHDSMEIKPMFSTLCKTDMIDLNIQSPDTSRFKISIRKVKTYKSSQKLYNFKSRSNLVFFQFDKTSSHNLPVKFNQELKQIFSAVITNEPDSVILKVEVQQKKPAAKQLNPVIMSIPVGISYLGKTGKTYSTNNVDFSFRINKSEDYKTAIRVTSSEGIEYKIDSPQVIDYLSRLLPKVYKISLLDTFEEIKSGVKNFLIKVDLLDEPPKIHQTLFDSISAAGFAAFHFKNEISSSIDKRIYIEKLSPLYVHFDKIYFPELLNAETSTFSSQNNIDFRFLLPEKNLFTHSVESVNDLLQPKLKTAKKKENTTLINSALPLHSPYKSKDQFAGIERIDYWIELDKEQRLEYDQEFFHAQNQIWDIYQTGNPYRLQAKVFTLIHQLKQILNFSSKAKSSKKSEFLLNQLNSMKISGQKAVVISQYDKYGTQKLTEIFNSTEIKFISCLPGIPQNELESSIKKFEKDESITVLLMAAKALPAKVQLNNFNAVIHFDQWWVPVSQWQLEDKLINGNKSNFRIINYFTKDTIDTAIKAKLDEYGLLNKNIVETVGADSFSKLLNENDWFDIFKLQPDKKNKELNEKISLNDFVKLPVDIVLERLNLLLSNLGFKNISYNKDDVESFFILRGSYLRKGQQSELTAFYFNGNKIPDGKTINELLENKVNNKTGKVFCISLNKDFKVSEIPPESISLINNQTLFNYLRIFRIV